MQRIFGAAGKDTIKQGVAISKGWWQLNTLDHLNKANPVPPLSSLCDTEGMTHNTIQTRSLSILG